MALMEIIAYLNSAEGQVLDKTPYLTSLGTYTVKPTETLDIETPSFLINYSATIMQCNYLYASQFRIFCLKLISGSEIQSMIASDPGRVLIFAK